MTAYGTVPATASSVSSPTGSGIARRLRQVPGAAVTVVLSLVVIGLLALLGARLAGYEPLVIRSGSMGEAVPTGSLVLTEDRPPTAIGIGDIVVIDPPGPAAPRMHRVIALRQHDGATIVRTKGDANPTADVGRAVLPTAVPAPALVIPRLGFVMAAVGSRGGLLLTAGVAVAIVGLSLLWALWRAPEPEPGPVLRAVDDLR